MFLSEFSTCNRFNISSTSVLVFHWPNILFHEKHLRMFEFTAFIQKCLRTSLVFIEHLFKVLKYLTDFLWALHVRINMKCNFWYFQSTELIKVYLVLVWAFYLLGLTTYMFSVSMLWCPNSKKMNSSIKGMEWFLMREEKNNQSLGKVMTLCVHMIYLSHWALNCTDVTSSDLRALNQARKTFKTPKEGK